MTDQEERASTFNIALCLSGGGFRATFFHLGVICLLRDIGFLQHVKHVASVSGGSILAAQLGLHWKDYSDPMRYSQFYRRVNELYKFGRMDVRGRIVRRMLLGGLFLRSFRRREQLVRHYSNLYGDESLSSLDQSGPNLHILSTSLTTGNLWSFSKNEVSVHRAEHLDYTTEYGASDIPVAKAVACSSAFPPLFPPIKFGHKDLHATKKEFPVTEYLTDGGVFDNLGVSKINNISDHIDLTIVSDASAPFDWATNVRSWGPITRNVRATDIMMNRIGVLQGKRSKTKISILMSIEDLVLPKHLGELGDNINLQDSGIQRSARFVRTDLDAFRHKVIVSLIRHGYGVALKQMWPLIKNTFSEDDRETYKKAIKDPCPLGWPNPKRISEGRVLTTMEKVAKNIHDANRILSALYGEPVAESHIIEKRKKDEQALNISDLKNATAWSLRLWSATDWASWMLVIGLGIFLSIAIYIVLIRF